MQTFQAQNFVAPTLTLGSIRHRIVGACAAFGVSITLLGATVALFGTASSRHWLPDTPEAVARAAACDRTGRTARDACMQEVVSRWEADARHAVRLASSR